MTKIDYKRTESWPLEEALKSAVTLEESKRNTLEMVYQHFNS